MFGAWGEASSDVHALLEALALVGIRRHYRMMRAKDPLEVHGALIWLLRRRWGLAAVRENARLKRERRQLSVELGVEECAEQPQPKPPPLPSSPLPKLPHSGFAAGGAAAGGDAASPKVLHAAVFKCFGFVFTMSVGSERETKPQQ